MIKYKWFLLKKNMRIVVRTILIANDNEKLDMFDSTNIETTAYCNRSCLFCFNNDRFPGRDKGTMAEELWKKIIDELSEINFYGRISLHFFGEPLLDRRIVKLISYARGKLPYAYIRLNSNGDVLTEELFMKLIENGMDYILITNYDDFENDNLNTLYKKYSSFIKYRNYSEISLANRAGSMQFESDNSTLKMPCLRPSKQLVIDWKGNVLLCCNDYYAKYDFGNVKNESIMSIWNSKKFKKYREILSKKGHRKKIDLCRNCDVE